MKNIFFTVFVAVGLLFFGSQQANAQQDISFGVKGGISLYNINTSVSAGGFSIDETSDRRLGFVLGAYAIVPFHDMFAFQPELLFVQKGGNDSNGDDDFFGGDTELILNYIDIPLLVRFNVPIETNLNPYLIAGPSVGFLVSATEKFDGESEDASDFLNSLNFGFNIGAGVNFGQLNVDLRYEFGLSNIFDDEDDFDDFFELNFDVTTSGLMLTVGYTF
ncbi:MAG: PorT family protein [Balneolia bacterium]|nr:PorT family protein [Balneolia bacterium]